jgi:HEAT repeat protein
VSSAVLLCLQLLAQAEVDPHFLDLVDRLRQDERWKARAESAMLLGRSRDIRARKPLTRALEDPHYAVRTAALRALTQLGDVRAVPDILDRFGDEEPFVRHEVERSLDRFELPAIRAYLVNALRRHPNAAVRLGAAMRLADQMNVAAEEALLDAAGDVDEVSRFAVSALRSLPEERASALFLRGLDHGDYKVQIASMRALADLVVPEAAERVVEMLESQVPEVTLAASRALEKLKDHLDEQKHKVAALRSRDPFERARSLKVLGFIGGEESSRLLLNALDHSDVLVRGAAVGALANLADVRAIPKLKEMKKHEENARIILLIRKTLGDLERISEAKEKLSRGP